MAKKTNRNTDPDAGWVDVRDASPNADTTVLIHCPAESEPIWLGYLDGHCWRIIEGNRIKVLHWCNLPAPPAQSSVLNPRSS